ncbi:MAG TPA: O-antigen ligase family protein [Candidatus Dormibacteraeota bacterium]|nr:O-antigen ligase family protein [Candidatus Dormibacteraeota bacterium]
MIDTPAARRRYRADAVTILTIYVFFLMGLPSGVNITPLGPIATPAVVMGLLALLWWANARLSPRLGMAGGFQPMRIPLFLLGAATLVSYAGAVSHPIADDVVSRAADKGVILCAAALGIAFLAADGIDSQERLDTLLRRVCLGASLMAVLGIVQYLTTFDINVVFQQIPGVAPDATLSGIAQRSILRRVEATARHPIEFGVVMAMILPIALHYFMHSPSGRRKNVAALEVVLIGVGLLLSVSRSAILGAVVAGVYLGLAWNWRQRLNGLVASAIFVAGAWMAFPGLIGTFSYLILSAGSDPSITGRTNRYDAIGGFIAQSPLIGRGFRVFGAQNLLITDNQYLNLLIEIGVLGLCAWILLFLVGVFAARGAYRRTTDPAAAHLSQALGASVLVLAVTFATFDALYYQMDMGLLFLVLGCCGAMWRLHGGPEAFRAPWRGTARRERPATVVRTQ